MSDFEFHDVTADEVAASFAREKTSKASRLVNEFVASGKPQAVVRLDETKSRDYLKSTAAKFIKDSGLFDQVGIRGIGPLDILLVNLTIADEQTRALAVARRRTPKVQAEAPVEQTTPDVA